MFDKLTDDQLHSSTVRTAEESRRITLLLLRHLNEIERRHLFSKFSVSSLHAYCVSQLKMDDGAAGRHVSAARLLREIPVIEKKIERGSMSLTSVSQAAVFFRREAQSGNTFAAEEKRELVMELENKSTREVDRFLISKSSAPEVHLKEKIIVRSEVSTELRLHVDGETLVALERLKEIWSHAMPNANFSDVIKRAATEALTKHDPLIKAKRAYDRAVAPAPERKADICRSVWIRDQGQCTFVDNRTGERCQARHFVEEDHIVPKAMGGAYTAENIRLRCRAHNQRHAIDCFGPAKMRVHLQSMR